MGLIKSDKFKNNDQYNKCNFSEPRILLKYMYLGLNVNNNLKLWILVYIVFAKLVSKRSTIKVHNV